MFPESVRQWNDLIVDAAWKYDFDPNLLSIIVTLETCGVDPGDRSSAGAQGLAGVMPYHFQIGEDGDDPWTNLRVGASYYAQGLRSSGGNIGVAFAGYNGGHTRIQKGYGYWPQETRSYHSLAISIYQDILADLPESPTIGKLWLCSAQ